TALSARVTGLDSAQSAALWQGGGTVAIPEGQGGVHTLDITLPRTQPSTGLAVDWANVHGAARLQAQDAQGRWHELARDAQAATRQQSWLAADAPLDIKA
ncbi:hypothetical protein ACWTQY_31145, partial [Klebsiella pneumoniae]